MTEYGYGKQEGRQCLRVVVVTGIFPPDIGGPATHAVNLADELGRRGHEVTVLTLTDGARITRERQEIRFPRSWPWPLRLGAVGLWLLRYRRSYDVVYATGLHLPAVAGARLARRPVVTKIVGDPAWERGARLGLVDASFEEFQQIQPHRVAERAMRRARDWTVRTASAVVVPSDYLGDVVAGWQRGRGAQVRVIPNGVVVPRTTNQPRHERSRSDRLQIVSVARLVAHKRIDELVRTVAETDGLELKVIGEGPELAPLERLVTAEALTDRVRFLGAVPHDAVLAQLTEADVLVSASSYEGLPHVVIEALALGTPVVASATGGTAEAVVDGENARLVEPATATTFAKVLGELRDDPSELERLAAGARASGERWRFDRCADATERLLRDVIGQTARPRIVNLGKSWIGELPSDSIERKFEIVARHLDATFVVTGPLGVRHVSGVRVVAFPSLRPRLLGGCVFYAAASFVALALASSRPGTAIVSQSPYEAIGVLMLRRLLPRSRRPRVVAEIHGDWCTATRLYGSRWRRLLSPATDRAATWAVRRADRVRVIGDFTEQAVRRTGRANEVDRYVAFSEYEEFLDPPPTILPDEPAVLFVGVLEPYKAPDVLIAAWAIVSSRIAGARLRLAGVGPMEAELRRQADEAGVVAGSVEFLGQVEHRSLVGLLDASVCLVLPSPMEGLGRAIVEAMARGRAVVGSNTGGIPELVDDAVTGLLVAPGDSDALAEALVRVLSDRDLAAAMGAEGRRRVEVWDPTAEFELGVARLAEWVAQR